MQERAAEGLDEVHDSVLELMQRTAEVVPRWTGRHLAVQLVIDREHKDTSPREREFAARAERIQVPAGAAAPFHGQILAACR